jgi:hypothetical protein
VVKVGARLLTCSFGACGRELFSLSTEVARIALQMPVQYMKIDDVLDAVELCVKDAYRRADWRRFVLCNQDKILKLRLQKDRIEQDVLWYLQRLRGGQADDYMQPCIVLHMQKGSQQMQAVHVLCCRWCVQEVVTWSIPMASW